MTYCEFTNFTNILKDVGYHVSTITLRKMVLFIINQDLLSPPDYGLDPPQDLHQGEGVHLGIGSDLLRSNPYTVYDEDITLNLKPFILTILIGLSTHCSTTYTLEA